MSILYILEQEQIVFNAGNELCLLTYTASDFLVSLSTQQAIQVVPGVAQNPANTPYPTFPDTDTGRLYYETAICNALVTQANTLAGATIYTGFSASLIPSAILEKFNTLASAAYSGNANDLNDFANLVTTSILSTALGGYASTSYVTSQISALINGAPGALDTLKELADAINDDASYAATITTALATKVTSAQAATAALSAALTGLSTSTNAAITSSDTVLISLGKLQAQVTAALAAVQPASSTITPSLVGTGATGSQVSSTKGALMMIGLSESVTSSIGGAAAAVVNIKICATNNATEAAWTTLGTFEEDQTITLAIALNSVQVMKGIVSFFLPAGWYWKAESSGSGTNSESILTGQQIIFG